MSSIWRNLLQRGLSLGALTMLTDCDISDNGAVRDFRCKAWSDPKLASNPDPADYRLLPSGKIETKTPWTVDWLLFLPQVAQITRHICAEVWSMIGEWTGAPSSVFLHRTGADTSARYVGFECADGYYDGIDTETALHPQTSMASKRADETLPRAHGFPFKLRIPTKLGFKNPKFVTTIYVNDKEPRGYWSDRGYNWFSGS